MLELPELPRSAFDLFARARWRKALDLGLAPPDGARFRSALRIAYDTLPDKREWEALAVEDERRFEREYQEALEKEGQENLGILSKDAPANRQSDSTTSDQRTDEDDEKLNGSSITPPSFSSRSLDTNCSDLTLESVWKKPRPCKSLLEGGSSLSELAPFVAAILRDKVVSDLMRESDKLKAEAKEHKAQKRRERIARKAIFMVAAQHCEASPAGGTDLLDNISSRDGCPPSIYCWATKYTASSSKQNNEKKVALLQSENRCKFRDLILAQFYVHGERVGCFAEDASSFSIKVYRSEESSSKKDVTGKIKDCQAEVVFFFTVGKHKYGFSTSCKSPTTQEMLLELGRADFPASEDEIDWEQAIDLDFLKRNVKPESRVRFQWAEQQQQQCVAAESDPSTRSER
jgi:hypothetical protein